MKSIYDMTDTELSASGKDELHEKLEEQWIYNQGQNLSQADFLPSLAGVHSVAN